MSKVFTVLDVAEMFCVTAPAVRYWVRMGWLAPCGRFPIRFTEEEVIRFREWRKIAPERRGGARRGTGHPKSVVRA